ncbi:MarR family winged helix-turn-helix transcriptional regulator [Acinetobacter guillouiae]|uniref:MarR family winged helix-turn-helix transcriptional regulator n=1 Tax=Acinetobacter guillouiae TaxID=106649 RepID=UPI0028D02157|nr:MarR family winged helix-turn-helix transcriptional regulator [Acinetobacter guillouiae]
MANKFSKFFPAHSEFNLDEFPYYWISQVHGLYIAKMDEALKKYGLDNSRRRILLACAAESNASISTLAELAIIKMPTATKIVYRLKDEGLVETQLCAEDNRVTRVTLTEQGWKMVSKINEITSLLLDDSFKGLKPNDLKKLTEFLKVIRTNLN